MIKVFRPFWSYDPHNTEAWLADMGGRGWLLEGWDLKRRQFSFREGKPADIIYQIGYDSAGNTPVSGSLASEGWSRRLQQGKWSVWINDKQPELIQAYPSRNELIKRNRRHSLLYMGWLSYVAVIAIILLLIIGLSVARNTPVRVANSPMWLVTGLAAFTALLLVVLALYSLVKISSGSKHLLRENKSSQKHELLPQAAGKKMIKLRLGWMYSPDRLENWLEKHEQQGNNLYRVGRLGVLFYFSKGSPRRIHYHADYQLNADQDYFELHKSAGWRNMHSTPFSIQKWTLWSREYSAGEERPGMYSDPFHRLKHARRIALSHTLMFLPLLLFYSLSLTAFISGMFREGFNTSRLLNCSLLFISVLLFGSFVCRTWMYYRRLKLSLS